MFTGLVETVGRVTAVARAGGLVTLTIESAIDAAELSPGESIAIDGYCQTVVAAEGKTFRVEVSPETLARTTAGKLRVGSRVNLERALRLSDRLGGHLVAGHVDGVGRIVRDRQEGRFRVLAVQIPPALSRYVIEKGSIAIDGISLTVNRVEGTEVEVGLIPHTRDRTTIADKRVGDEVNIEVDLVGKYVEKLLSGARGGEGVTWDLLKEHGFLR